MSWTLSSVTPFPPPEIRTEGNSICYCTGGGQQNPGWCTALKYVNWEQPKEN